jgi:hypothetical protein
MQIKQVSMTPDWALQILEQNTHNRSSRPTLVAQIANDICAGRWLLTPQTCSIATDGTLLDGQHRLMAIVKSGQTVPLMLATECPPEVFTAIDTGVSRTAGDLLRIEGIANYNNIAALIKAVTLYRNTPHVVWTSSCYPISKQAILDIYKSDPSGWDKSGAYYKVSNACKFAHPTTMATLHYLYSQKSPELGYLVSNYIHQFISGELLSFGSPILAIRNYMSNNYKARTSSGRQGQFHIACHIKAFSYWRDDCELRLFKVPTIVPMPML